MLAESTIWYAIFGMPQVAILMACVISLGSVIAYYWHKTIVDRSANELKQSMIERGYSAEDIERTLAAGSGTTRHSRD